MKTNTAKAKTACLFAAAFLISVGSTSSVSAQPTQQEQIRLGIAAPLSGPFELLGNQLVEGVRAQTASKEPKQAIELSILDDECSAEGGIKAAQAFIEAETIIAGGFLCMESLEAALPLLEQNNIPIIAAGASAYTLTERRVPYPLPVFRLETGLEKESDAIISILSSLWRQQAFAVIDDGTIEGRELASRILTGMKQRGMEPVFTDTFRPGLDNQNALVSRLRRAGASHVFIGGEAADAAAIAQSARTLKYDLSLAGGSILRSSLIGQNLPAGTLMIAPPEPEILAGAKTVEQALNKSAMIAEGNIINGYALAQIAQQAIEKAKTLGESPIKILQTESFETVLGTIQFNEQGLRRDNPNRLHRYDGRAFVLEK